MDLNKLSFRERILHLDPSIQYVPKGYKRIENKIILRYNENLDRKLGQAVIQAFPWCTGVFQQLNTIGENRRPELIHLAGNKETVVTHVENRTKYVLDISKITFSGGNRELRKRLVEKVSNNECLFDMFAAVGNLSLQVLKYRDVKGILVEKDPYTFSFLQQSVYKNRLRNAKILNVDCREVKIEQWADRVFMGYHEVDESHLSKALKACKSQAILHIHPLAHKTSYSDVENNYRKWIENLGITITNFEVNKIKSYSPNLDHIEIVVSIEK